MFLPGKRALVFLLTAAIVGYGLPRRASAASTLERGADTSEQAARPSTPAPVALADAAAAGEPVLAFGGLQSYSDPDTTDFEFPDEENKHLVRDVTVWVIASAFVAYFIIKVFLEEDEPEEEEEGPPGKDIP